jgi:DNA-binding TFAR19-related protein (PDSD5 family)
VSDGKEGDISGKGPQDAQVSRALKAGMKPEAYERLMTVKTGDQKVYDAALRYVLYYIQRGQIVDEQTLVKMLETVSSSMRKDISISFRRK